MKVIKWTEWDDEHDDDIESWRNLYFYALSWNSKKYFRRIENYLRRIKWYLRKRFFSWLYIPAQIAADDFLLHAGTDRRGTIYGIYDFCEWLGVSPWYFFADVPVRRRSEAVIENGYCKVDYPSVEYIWYGLES